MAFIIIGALGFIWMGFWIFMYDKPKNHKKVNNAELEYIQQDDIADSKLVGYVPETTNKVTFSECFRYKPHNILTGNCEGIQWGTYY